MGLAAGSLNTLITINKPNPARDALNRPVAGFVLHKQKWADPRTPSGMATIRDEAQGGVPSLSVAYSFRVRFDTSINETMQVQAYGMTFDITRVIHDLKDREWTDLVCKHG